ncbi:RICIN domain-containing protein [Streptomyces sp. NBC_01210]|uniref:RICIN domain-containing protein n=1 Tax=Streptomyces sp. NBC_01210 TaxID=2903774 RepID=UPI002E112FF3|nr:RICIN domain-containing protein [Streptomyces sp. NBC_01210]
MTAGLLTLALSALSVAVSPLTTGIANADSSDLEGLTLKLADERRYLDLDRDSSEAGVSVVAKLYSDVVADEWSFVPVPDSNGRFQIRNDRTGGCIDFNSDNDHLNKNPTCDPNNPKQNWYIQPSDLRPNTYIIRNYRNNKCMDRLNGYSNLSGVTVGLYGCGNRNTNQAWEIQGNSDNAGAALDNMALSYALKQYEDRSDIIRSATYVVDADRSDRAVLAAYQNVTQDGGSTTNYSTLIADHSVSWSQTTGTTVTITNGFSTMIGVDFKFSPVPGRLTDVTLKTSITQTYSSARADSTSATETGTRVLRINPGEHGWVLRAQLTKTVRGTWTVQNDLGTSWTGLGTATVPVAENTDNRRSDVVLCTSDSEQQLCRDTDPASA